MMDLVFPRNNEVRLVEMAARLGVRTLFLCYPAGARDLDARAKDAERIGARFAVYCERQPDVQRARRLTKDVVARGGPWAFDDKRVRFVMRFESGTRPDFTHHRNAGLNQVFVKKTITRGQTILVDASQLRDDPGVVLGRMMQNNKLYRKYGPDVRVVSCATAPLAMRNPRDMQALLSL